MYIVRMSFEYVVSTQYANLNNFFKIVCFKIINMRRVVYHSDFDQNHHFLATLPQFSRKCDVLEKFWSSIVFSVKKYFEYDIS